MNTKILLIDDDARILETFARMLKLAGYTVFTAESGEEGLTLYHQENPDIVLLDLRMPGMDGLEVLQAMRAHDPEANVILATGHGDKDAVIEALRAGASDFLSKPIDQVSLESALRRAEERIALKRKLRASQEALQRQNERLEETVKARTAELEREIEEHKQTEVTLRESEEHYRTLVEGTEEAIATANEKGVLLFVNSVAARRLGGKPEDFVGQSMHDLFPPDVADRQAADIQHVIETQRSLTTKTTTILQGMQRWYRTSIQPLRDYEGNVHAALLIARDITEEKRAEEALRESEEKYRLLAETTHDIIVLHDMEGLISYVNQAGLDFAGFSAAEAIGQPITTFIPTNHLAEIETRRTQRASGDDQAYRYETEFVNRDGQPIPVEVHSTPVIREGRVSEILLVARDITERKYAEEAIRAERERLDDILSTLETGLSLINPDMTIAWVNRKIRDMFPDEDPIGRRCHAFYESRDTLCENCGTRVVFQTGETQVRERCNPVDGRWYTIISQPIKDANGNVVNVLEGITDITERKRVEEALRESLVKYRVLFDTFPLGITIADRNGKILEANQVSKQLLGLSLEEHTTRDIDGEEWHIIRPDGSPMPAEEYASVRALRESRLVSNVEMGIIKPDGEITWISVTAAPLMDDRVVIAYDDISERKWAEEALRESEERYRTVCELTSDFAYASQIAPDGTYTPEWATKPIDLFTGYSRDEMRESGDWIALIHPDDARAAQQHYQNLLSGQVDSVEFRIVTPEGETRWVRNHAYPIWNEAEGRVVRIIGAAQEITQRKESEEALKKSEERLRYLIESAGDRIFINDLEGRCLYYNGPSRYGLEPADVVGKLAGANLSPTEAESIQRELRLVARSGEHVHSETCRKYLGKERWFFNDRFPIRDAEGEVVAIGTISREITERKRAEQALRLTTKRLRILHEIDAAILAAQSPKEIACVALNRLQDLIPCQRYSFSQINLTRQVGRDVVIFVGGSLKTKPSDWHSFSELGNLVNSIQHGVMHHVEDIPALESPSSLEQKLSEHGLRSYISVPLRGWAGSIGALNLASDMPGFFQPHHIEMIKEIANSLSVAFQQAHLLEQAQQDAETKALLLREVNHRVMNNLTMILGILSLEERRSLDSKADFQAALGDVANRIQGIATVHRMLSESEWAPLELKKLVEKVIHAALSGSPNQRHIEIVVEAPDDPLHVTARQAIAVALVINELTTNSVKYAFRDRSEGRIDVRITPIDGYRWHLIFRDDGPGFPDEVLAGKQRNTGICLVEANVSHTLGGEVKLQNDDGAVTSITFEHMLLNDIEGEPKLAD